MKVLLWEMGKHFCEIVLWDGECTYWHDNAVGSSGYFDPGFIGRFDPITRSTFTYIGELE